MLFNRNNNTVEDEDDIGLEYSADYHEWAQLVITRGGVSYLAHYKNSKNEE